jgi:hypothetical protein
MVPGILMAVDSFALTVNGKLDRRALPEPEVTGESDYQGPRTATERLLAGIWEQVLGVERVGVGDNFFQIGGNSILAIQASHRMSRSLGREVKVADIFKYKTLEEIIENISRIDYDLNVEKEF